MCVSANIETLKQCKDCSKVLPIEQFTLYNKKKNGKYYQLRRTQCDSCWALREKEKWQKQKGTEAQKARTKKSTFNYRQKKIENGEIILGYKSYKISVIPCTCCGKLKTFKGNKKSYTCSTRCRGAMISNGARGIAKSIKEVICPNCQSIHTKVQANSRCLNCVKEAEKKYKRLYGGDTHRSRANRYNTYYEAVNVLKVFEADKWRCKECGIKVRKYSDSLRHDDRATLGHIVPMSLGGSHSYSNVQCECWKCNTSKGNKVGKNVQIDMFSAPP